MRYLLITCLFFVSCGSQNEEPSTPIVETMSAEDEERYLKLLGQVSEINNIVLSDFNDCSQTGDTSDPLIRRICEVAQASTVEAKVEMKAELKAAVDTIQEQLDYIKEDVAGILDQDEEVQDRLNAAEATIITLNTRLTALETQVENITEGICYRSRTTSPSLNGSLVTFAWDDSLRMNSSFCTYNIPTAEYTIQKAGWYQVSYKVNFEHTNGNTDLSYRSWILLNNTTELDLSRVHSFTVSNAQGEFTTMNNTFIRSFSVGDIIEVQNDAADGTGAFGAGNASYNLIGPESFFMVKYIDD